MYILDEWGWDPFYFEEMENIKAMSMDVARIVHEQRGLYRVISTHGLLWAGLSGNMSHMSHDLDELPAVGDWVSIRLDGTCDRAVIHGLLPRRSVLVRQRLDSNRNTVKQSERQVLAANVDLAFIVCALSDDINPGRIERYATLAWNGGIQPVVLLTKTDMCDDPEGAMAEAMDVSPGLTVLAVSARMGTGLEEFMANLRAGSTSVLLGPSGAGKSTLINRLLGKDVQSVGAIREMDGKGRHTTTSRCLFRLDNGALIIDTPGLRSIGLTAEESGLSHTFEDIEAVARGCRFKDCLHQGEPGCAVREALEKGLLEERRLEGYLKIRKEVEYQVRRSDKRAMKKDGKKLAKKVTEMKKFKRRKGVY